MRNKANQTIDSITFTPTGDDAIVDVKTENGAIFQFNLVRIGEDVVVLKKPDSKLIALAKSDSVVINRSMVLGTSAIKRGDMVLVKTRDGSVERFEVDLIFNNDLVVISKPGRRKLGFIDKIKFIWQAKGL